MSLFDQLPQPLPRALSLQAITSPTPVQERAIPAALAGHDVLGSAQTGTGKTLAFLLPLTVHLLLHDSDNALVLTPTRELAQQIAEEFEKLTPLPHALIIGGDNIHKQYALLRRKPRLIIATPGRLLDHIGRKSVNLKNTCFWVLDETDRMLDMGFIEDMRRIAAVLPAKRQTLLFSATVEPEIEQLAAEFLHGFVRVSIEKKATPAQQVLQEAVYVDIREKLPQLLHELSVRAGSVLVFTNTKHGAERLTKELKRYGQKASALHGELRQNRRRQVLEFFKNQTVRILVATDLAARGLDVPHIAHVINYDLPQSPEDFIHRIGRTGRAGAVGNALSLVVEKDKWREICRLYHFPVKMIEKTLDPLPAPKFVAVEESAVRKKKKASPYTRRAKELLQSGEVHLPQSVPQRPAVQNQATKTKKMSMRALKAAQFAPTVRKKGKTHPFVKRKR